MSQTLRRILYIDGDDAVRALVQRELARQGCEVHAEADGDAALLTLASRDFDAVALDHLDRGMDGLQVLERIRQTDKALPVIFVTAAAESRLAVAVLKAGATDYVVKDGEGHFIVLIKAAVENALAEQAKDCTGPGDDDLRAARDRFEALAAERALLLREVNHRVSNSLQLIASMLQIQANASGSEETRKALSNAMSRVLAVAEVHKRLYTSDTVEAVALDQYLDALIDDLRRSSDDMGLEQLQLAADAVSLDPDRAVALGVIVNELVINAWKYAYPGGSGPIRIGLRRDGAGRVRLAVEDDGVGMTREEMQRSSGLGQKIVGAMIQKLEADLQYEPKAQGTRAVVSFFEHEAEAEQPAA
ncbi:histidine kinase dimerization/phosphoacceptor domain -containing protein [Methyloligella sp. 2.7D]|uniref:sensor histidine kinase n=1 Tax=unclassified Methyloligella TaxID=2625955 RepID=UPI00157C68F4|nr:histidine kinase dimerization/phosphoacceptor domain -containing protein [Methyloligella sp. GL2]QKP77032.1 response regulator [Methyloligella sp. GL2]